MAQAGSTEKVVREVRSAVRIPELRWACSQSASVDRQPLAEDFGQ